MKKCTSAQITSFKVKSEVYTNQLYFFSQMKYAVDRSLAGSKYETEDVGTSLNRVLQYFTLRDKFTGIHPDLARELGIKEVKVTMEGLKFLR